MENRGIERSDPSRTQVGKDAPATAKQGANVGDSSYIFTTCLRRKRSLRSLQAYQPGPCRTLFRVLLQ